MYREDSGADPDDARANQIAQTSVLDAWNDYLAHDNDGRGVVLIGHSEGASRLALLLTDHIDRVPAVRRRLVSAILTGADLLVDVHGFGPLTTIGPCRSVTQTGCVVAFNAFATSPPADSRFGRLGLRTFEGRPVEDVCTNPADLAGGEGPLRSMYRTHLATSQVAGSTTQGIFDASAPPRSSTPWIEYLGLYTARCAFRDGAHVLMVTRRRGAPVLVATPDATWGLHVDDPNLAMGNLVALVASEAAAYAAAPPVRPAAAAATG
jgi:hypothetical protein